MEHCRTRQTGMTSKVQLDQKHKSKSKLDETKPPVIQPTWLVTTLKTIASTCVQTTTPSMFKFENTLEAATFNSNIIEKYGMDLERAVEDDGNSTLKPGTEFRKLDDIQNLANCHKDSKVITSIIKHGASYPIDLQKYSETTRLSDLEAGIVKGNNKSAEHPEGRIALQKAYTKEVNKGWMIPITIDTLRSVKGAGVIPIGCTVQHTINENGERIQKRRTTHDCSQKNESGFSVNLACQKDELEDCIYGYCLLRTLHNIHTIRIHNPSSKIYINKTDLDAAFRRLHVVLKYALLCCTIIDAIAYILVRLPFGSAPAPSQFTIISEFVIDIAQQLTWDASWNPETLQHPQQELLPEPEDTFDRDTPFGKAWPLLVNVEYTPIYVDGFVDDLITVCAATNDNVARARQAVPLVIHCLFRPENPKDATPRDGLLSRRKMLGEGALSEIKTVLGWKIDTRNFKISLEPIKRIHWTTNIDDMVKLAKNKQKVRTKDLESMIGKLNHACYVVNEGRFFLSRLRRRLRLCKKYRQNKLKDGEVQDLLLWKTLLTHMDTHGRSINHVTMSIPHLFCISDASKFGIGGFNSEGIAWRYEIPPEHRGKLSLNLLEFIAARITIRFSLDLLQIRQTCTHGIRIHSLTDNSSALSWMWAANFDPVSFPNHDKVSRQLALDLMESDCSLSADHIKGEHNMIADSLSRDFHISQGMLTKELYRKLGDQMPKNFRIFGITPTLTSWISSLMQCERVEKVSVHRRHRSKIAHGINGDDFLRPPISPTAFWPDTLNLTEMGSSLPLRSHSDAINLAKRLKINCEKTLSKQQCLKWRRPSERLVLPTQPLMPKANAT